MDRYMITHSLLSSWLYAMKENPYEDATSERNSYAEFMDTLKRKSTPTNEAMQNGIDFENFVTSIIEGERTAPCEFLDDELKTALVLPREIREHPWFSAASKVADSVRGGLLQCAAKREVIVRGQPILLYGRLDALKAGVIYDIKFSKVYDAGKYLGSTQHQMYMALVPEAYQFTYLISNGQLVWNETYLREDIPDILKTVIQFFDWLDRQGLGEIYRSHWRAL